MPAPSLACRHGARAALLAIALLAVAVRLYGIDFGLPDPRARPDEGRIGFLALRTLYAGPDPGFYVYPSLFLYAVALGSGALFLAGRAAGAYASLPDFVGAAMVDPSPVLLVARALSVAAGTATVLVTARLGRIAGGPRAGLLAAFFLALAYLHARDSHFGTTDVPMTLLAVGAVAAGLRLARAPTAAAAAAAGGLAGLATATKYSAAALGPVLLLALGTGLARTALRGAAPSRRVRASLRALADRRTAALAGGFAGALALGTPFALLHPQRLAHQLGAELAHQRTGQAGLALAGGWEHLRFTLPYGLGLPLLGAGVAGGVLLAFRRPRLALLLFAYPVLHFAAVATSATAFVRYMVPLVPFFCVGAGVAVSALAERFGSSAARRAGVAAALALLVALPSAARLVRLDALLARDDTRVVARRWMAEHLPRGASLHQPGSEWAGVLLPPGVPELERKLAALERGDVASGGGLRFRRAVLRARIRHTRAAAPARLEERPFRRGSGFADTGGAPRFVLVSESPLRHYVEPSAALRRLLEERYRLRRRFRSAEPLPPARWYDRQDAFFLPYARFTGVQRPGPDLLLYERRSRSP